MKPASLSFCQQSSLYFWIKASLAWVWNFWWCVRRAWIKAKESFKQTPIQLILFGWINVFLIRICWTTDESLLDTSFIPSSFEVRLPTSVQEIWLSRRWCFATEFDKHIKFWVWKKSANMWIHTTISINNKQYTFKLASFLWKPSGVILPSSNNES